MTPPQDPPSCLIASALSEDLRTTSQPASDWCNTLSGVVSSSSMSATMRTVPLAYHTAPQIFTVHENLTLLQTIRAALPCRALVVSDLPHCKHDWKLARQLPAYYVKTHNVEWDPQVWSSNTAAAPSSCKFRRFSSGWAYYTCRNEVRQQH